MLDSLIPKTSALIVDDEEMIRDIVAEAVSQIPAIKLVVKSPNGADAYIKAQNQQFAFAVIDLSMPKVGGIELIERIREIEKKKKWPAAYIIIISGNVQSDEVKAAVKMGVKDIVVKPFKVESITDRIEEEVKKKNLV